MFKELLPYLSKWFEQAEIRGYSIPPTYGKEHTKGHSDASSGVPSSFDLDEVFEEFVDRMKLNYPFHHPDYAGQMLKPPHPVAWLAYSMAMSVNTNNHALDGGPPTSEMEKEVVAKLAKMFGYGDVFLGHLTSGGTIANLEALWISKSLHPDKPVLFSDASHYTHKRMCDVLGVESRSVSLAEDENFEQRLKAELKEAGTLVVTVGTTGTGVIEPLHRLLPLCREAGVRIHVDAAYGGFFKLLAGSGLIDSKPWDVIHEVDSIVVDPHKHGLQPYGCGCVLFKDPAVGRFYKHDSPYTYFSSDELHLGEITLECSRAGAAAAALWFTLKCFGLSSRSPFAAMLEDCVKAAKDFANRMENARDFGLYIRPETDIVVYFPKAENTAEVSRLSREIFQDSMRQGQQSLYLSLFKVDAKYFTRNFPDVELSEGEEQVTLLRSVFMKPSHLAFTGEMEIRLNASLKRINS
ncbi:MAG: aminotransferase class I/II-fold pyridoxal phosphate-dependent enzyme [Balneolia bacterium]|nr:aminotransferase class I/II-fold pyridoxal phosphate-dependent enzyme [Balneolia bacterium]